MWEIHFTVGYKRILHGTVPVFSGWYSLTMNSHHLFFWKPKFITFPRAHHRAVSHNTWTHSYIFTPHKKTHSNLQWSTFAKDFQMVSNVLSFRLIILYTFHPLTNVAYSVHLIGFCLSLCYYDTSLICKKTFSIVFNTYTTLSHTTFRKLLLSCVFRAKKKVLLPISDVLQVAPLSRNCMVQPVIICTQVQNTKFPIT